MRNAPFFKSLKKLLIGVAAVLVPYMAYAQASSPVTYTDFFTVPAGDMSAQMIQGIVGDTWATVTGDTETTPVDAIDNTTVSGGLMGVISGVMSTACMMLAAVIVLYGGAFAAIEGARSGTSAAQRYDTFWAPLRACLSLALLAPIAGGYCLIQVIVMKVAFLGIGIGDVGYRSVLNYVTLGKPISSFAVPSVTQSAQTLLRSVVCQTILNGELGGGAVVMNTNDKVASQSFLASHLPFGLSALTNPTETHTYTVSFDSAPGSGLPTQMCGSASFSTGWQTGSSTLSSAGPTAYNARKTAMMTLISSLQSIANTIYSSEQPGSAPIGGGTGGDPMAASETAFQSAALSYMNAVRTSASAALASTSANTLQPSDLAVMQNAGWLMMGGYYWNLHALNAQANSLIGKQMEMLGPQDGSSLIATASDAAPIFTATMLSTESVIDRAASGMPSDSSAVQTLANAASSIGSEHRTDTTISSYLSRMGMFSANYMISKITADGDQISNLQDLGQDLFGVGTSMVGIALGSEFAAGIADGVKKEPAASAIPGVGLVTSIVSSGLGVLAKVAGEVGPILILIGIFLGFYLPAIPLIIWCSNVLGWLVQFSKFMLSAPLWAASIANPEGPGIVGSSGRQGLIMMIGLILRPLLLVGGIILGMMVLQAAGLVSSTLFPLMMNSAFGNDTIFMFSALVLVALYGVLYITLAHKAFALSHEVADEVTRWIGGNIESLGDTGSEQAARATIGGTGARMGQDVGRNLMRPGDRKMKNPPPPPGRTNGTPGTDNQDSHIPQA